MKYLYWLGLLILMTVGCANSSIEYANGMDQFRKQNYEKAVASFTHAMEIAPDSMDFHFWNSQIMRGNTYMKRFHQSSDSSYLQLALQDFSQVLALHPEDGETWFRRGVAWSLLNQFDSTYSDYTRFIQLEPDNPKTWEYRAGILFQMKRYDDALADLDSALVLNPDHLPSLRSKSAVLTIQKRFNEAKPVYDHLIEIEPEDATNWFLRANYHAIRQDTVRWLADLNKTIALDSTSWYVYEERARCFRAMGNMVEAEMDSIKAEELRP